MEEKDIWKKIIKDLEEAEKREDRRIKEPENEEEYGDEEYGDVDELEEIIQPQQNIQTQSIRRIDHAQINPFLESGEPVDNLEQGVADFPTQTQTSEQEERFSDYVISNAPEYNYSSNYDSADYAGERIHIRDAQMDTTGGALIRREEIITRGDINQNPGMNFRRWQGENVDGARDIDRERAIRPAEDIKQDNYLPFEKKDERPF